jgi:hypothetical protein
MTSRFARYPYDKFGKYINFPGFVLTDTNSKVTDSWYMTDIV